MRVFVLGTARAASAAVPTTNDDAAIDVRMIDDPTNHDRTTLLFKLVDALEHYYGFGGNAECDDARIAPTERWLFRSRGAGFETICSTLEVDPEPIRTKLRHLRSRRYGTSGEGAASFEG